MLAQININNQELTTLVPPETALARGSSFANLYIPYKYEATKILKGSNPRQNILALIDIYTFLIVDLNMFLNTHPNNERAKALITTFKTELNKLKDYYNTNFSPLTMDAVSNESYITGPWPWEDRF
ncbi:MAG: spore coat protein CotJB [Clostridia bacterium]|nr:spore coat protein CotJB [Clostridia bacterium]